MEVPMKQQRTAKPQPQSQPQQQQQPQQQLACLASNPRSLPAAARQPPPAPPPGAARLVRLQRECEVSAAPALLLAAGCVALLIAAVS